MSHKRSGFTTIELLVVVSLVAIILAVLTQFAPRDDEAQVRGAATRLQAVTQQARIRAVTLNSFVGIYITNTGYTLFKNDVDRTHSANDVALQAVAFSKGDLNLVAASTPSPILVMFSPLGTVHSATAGILTLSSVRKATFRYEVRITAQGSVTVNRL